MTAKSGMYYYLKDWDSYAIDTVNKKAYRLEIRPEIRLHPISWSAVPEDVIEHYYRLVEAAKIFKR
jgi:hypothetical protein